MLLSRFTYHRPTELAAVFELMARYGDDAAVYAGGTELLLAMKARVLRYAHLIDLKHVGDLKGIRRDGDWLVVGPLTTHHQLATDPDVRRLIPAYAALSANIANIRVRVAGTIGGNLCFAEPHADPPALLAAMGATMTLRSAESTRSVAAGEFIAGEFVTARTDDELLTDIRIPVTGANERFIYSSFGHLERPAVGVAAGRMADGSARVWVGAIGDHPLHMAGVESAAATGGEALETAIVEAAVQLPAHDDLHGSADYKRHLAGVLMRRSLAEVAGSEKRA